MSQAVTIKNEKQMKQANKYETLISTLVDYLLSDIRLPDEGTIKFSIVDYFCLTDIKTTELMAYIRRFKQNMDSFERRVLCTFLGKYQDLGDVMTEERLHREKLSYIINGEEKAVTPEMWKEIQMSFFEHNIPDNRLVMNVAARRMIYGQPVLPLVEIAQKENKAIEYIKK